MPTRHFLVEGMYLRQILIPAGTIFVGRRHKKLHYFICLRGSAGLQTEDGIKRICAGMVLMSAPGDQRIGVTYEDTIFATIHRTEETELAAIEDDVVEFDPDSRYGVGNQIIERLEDL